MSSYVGEDSGRQVEFVCEELRFGRKTDCGEVEEEQMLVISICGRAGGRDSTLLGGFRMGRSSHERSLFMRTRRTP